MHTLALGYVQRGEFGVRCLISGDCWIQWDSDFSRELSFLNLSRTVNFHSVDWWIRLNTSKIRLIITLKCRYLYFLITPAPPLGTTRGTAGLRCPPKHKYVLPGTRTLLVAMLRPYPQRYKGNNTKLQSSGWFGNPDTIKVQSYFM